MHKIKFTILVLFVSALSGLFAQNEYVFLKKGRLYHPNGEELALWGVNLQPMLSWEYNSMMKKAGIPKDAEVWKKMTDKSLDELQLLGANYIRVHLTPGDFTDADGNLVETIYLDLLDYLTAEAPKYGIYICYAFFNHMGRSEVAESFMETSYKIANVTGRPKELKKKHHKALRMFESNFFEASKKYIKNLLKRTNPYNNKTYNSDANIVAWEIMNEPVFFQRNNLKTYPQEHRRYQSWLAERGVSDIDKNYFEYRKQRVLQYINGIHDAIRKGGAVVPVIWSLNWHRFRNGHEDIFEAVAESKVEAVAFCTYPGQNIAKQRGGGNYESFSGDLSSYDFSEWFRRGYNQQARYGWLKSEMFSDKAKVVYEFESFYNHSSYIYPALADFQRSLGAQAAAMWHYSMTDYAQYNGGSHVFNLKTTPAKAAAFAVASKVFQNTPILQNYHVESPSNFQSQNFSYSLKKNRSIYSDDSYFFYSNDVLDMGNMITSKSPKEIFGYGKSPLVNYEGTGTYQLKISEKEIIVHIQPDVVYNHSLSYRSKKKKHLITEFEDQKKHAMTISIDGWESGKFTIFKLTETGKKKKIKGIKELRLKIAPGKYKITKT